MTDPARRVPLLPSLLFFASGAAGLIYQVVWMRLAGLHLGVTSAAVGTVVATFLGGLAIGSAWGGRWMDRALQHRPTGFALRVYGLLELAIGAYALAFAPMLEALTSPLGAFYGSGGDRGTLFLLFRCLVCAVVILPPTAAMGATLPILARHASSLSPDPARLAGRLYALNTLGGVVGAVCAGWLLLPLGGLQAATGTAVAVNAAVGLAALLAGRGGPSARPAAEEVPRAEAPRWIFPAYLLSGFAALICEVAWTRGLILALGSSVYAFSLTLACFILGLGLGGAAGTPLAARVRDPIRLFAFLELAGALLAAASVPVLERLPMLMMRAMTPDATFGSVTAVQAGLAALVILFPAALMGAMFPALCRAVLATGASVGTTVGRLYSWNAAGNIAGALTASFALLAWRGVPGTILFASAVNILVAAWAFSRQNGGSRWGPPLTLAGGLALMVATPGWDLALVSTTPIVYGAKYVRNEGDSGGGLADRLRAATRIVFHRWDASGLVTVHQAGELFSLRVNGKVDASTHGDLLTQTLVSHVPLLLHPDPREMLVVGLGSGSTSAAALCHPVGSVRCVELSPAVVEAAALFEGKVGHWRNDPRLHISVTDARTHVRFTRERYDVIAAEPSNLWLSGMATLFTREQFQRYRAILKPGGIVCQWVQAYRLSRADFASVVATFREVFPNCSLWEIQIAADYVLVGTTGEEPEYESAKRRFQEPRVKEDLRKLGVHSLDGLLHAWIGGPRAIEALAKGATVLTDDFCPVEYTAPRELVQEKGSEIMEALDAIRPLPGPGLRNGPDPGPWREERRILASALVEGMNNGPDEAFFRLAQARNLDTHDPALHTVMELISRSAYVQALELLKAGNSQAAARIFGLIPETSELSSEARRISAGIRAGPR